MTEVRAFFHDVPVLLDNLPSDVRTMARIFGMDSANVSVELFMDKRIFVIGVGDLEIHLWGDKVLIIELIVPDEDEVVLFDGKLPDEIRNAADLEHMARGVLTQWMFEEIE